MDPGTRTQQQLRRCGLAALLAALMLLLFFFFLRQQPHAPPPPAQQPAAAAAAAASKRHHNPLEAINVAAMSEAPDNAIQLAVNVTVLERSGTWVELVRGAASTAWLLQHMQPQHVQVPQPAHVRRLPLPARACSRGAACRTPPMLTGSASSCRQVGRALQQLLLHLQQTHQQSQHHNQALRACLLAVVPAASSPGADVSATSPAKYKMAAEDGRHVSSGEGRLT